MLVFIGIIILLGLFEIISNLVHFAARTKETIGLSAKRQHQELSLDLHYMHFYYKAIIMFIFGIMQCWSGIVAITSGNYLFLQFVLAAFGVYGIVQAFVYRRPYKVWMSAIVYLAPVIAFYLIK